MADEHAVYMTRNAERNPTRNMEVYVFAIAIGVAAWLLKMIADVVCAPWSDFCMRGSQFLGFVYTFVFIGACHGRVAGCSRGVRAPCCLCHSLVRWMCPPRTAPLAAAGLLFVMLKTGRGATSRMKLIFDAFRKGNASAGMAVMASMAMGHANATTPSAGAASASSASDASAAPAPSSAKGDARRSMRRTE